MKFKITCYGVHDYERPYFEKLNCYSYELVLTNEFLNADNADLAKGSDAVLLRGNCLADAANLEKFKSWGISLVFTRTVGIDHIDLKAAKELGIRVARVPSYSPASVAELAVSLAMALFRSISLVSSQTSQGQFKVAPAYFCREAHSSTIGIIGTGRIGLAEAKIWHGFGAKILAYDLYQNPAAKEYLTYVDLPELLAESDIVSLHVPYVKGQNEQMINAEQLATMKDEAILINTARGELIDYEAVLAALQEQRLAGFGTDVFLREEEIFNKSFDSLTQLPNTTAQKLIELYPRVLVMPHMGSLTQPALEGMISTSYDNFHQLLSGKKLENEVTY